jgi:hypothetical protein
VIPNNDSADSRIKHLKGIDDGSVKKDIDDACLERGERVAYQGLLLTVRLICLNDGDLV